MLTAGEEALERPWRGRSAEGREGGGGGEGSPQDAGQGARGTVRGAGASAAPGRSRGRAPRACEAGGLAARRGRGGGPRASPLPAAQRMREPPGSRCGGRHKVSRDEGRAGPRPPGPASRPPGSRQRQVPPAPRSLPGPAAPYRLGPATADTPSSCAAPGFCGLPAARAPPSPLRPRPGRAARTLPAPHRPLPRGGRAARGGGGASAREARYGVGGGRRGTRGAAGSARAHCSVRCRAELRGAPGVFLDVPWVGRLLESPPVFHNIRPLSSPLRGWGWGAGVVYWSNFWMREG